MPRTRTEIDRGEKVSEILDEAERQLREGGYNALSVAAIARELGLAHNAIYWYFPSKDHLVVATFEHMIQKLLARKQKESGDVIKKVMWFVDQLGELYPLKAAMNDEAQRSEVIAGYLDELNERLRSMAAGVLAPYVPPDDLDMAATSFVATVQGTFLYGTAPAERRRLLTYTLEKLIGKA